MIFNDICAFGLTDWPEYKNWAFMTPWCLHWKSTQKKFSQVTFTSTKISNIGYSLSIFIYNHDWYYQISFKRYKRLNVWLKWCGNCRNKWDFITCIMHYSRYSGQVYKRRKRLHSKRIHNTRSSQFVCGNDLVWLQVPMFVSPWPYLYLNHICTQRKELYLVAMAQYDHGKQYPGLWVGWNTP